MNPENSQLIGADIQVSFRRLYQWAAANNVAVETIQKDSEEDFKRRQKNMTNARTNETSKLANDYRMLAMDFKSRNKKVIETFKQEHPQNAEIDEALKTITGYEVQIPMLITQAYIGLSEFVETTTHPVQNGFNECAKMVVAGVENSFFAWERILKNIPSTETGCMHLLMLLDRIYKRIAADFPNAGLFV